MTQEKMAQEEMGQGEVAQGEIVHGEMLVQAEVRMMKLFCWVSGNLIDWGGENIALRIGLMNYFDSANRSWIGEKVSVSVSWIYACDSF